MERMREGLKAARSNEPPRSVHALVSKPRLLFLQELPAWVNHGSNRTETAVTTFTAKRRKGRGKEIGLSAKTQSMLPQDASLGLGNRWCILHGGFMGIYTSI